MEDTVLMQVFEAPRHVPTEFQRVLAGERVLLDHLADVEAVDELEDDERRAAGNEVGVDHLHDVRVIGDLKERFILFLEPVDG